MKTLELIKEGDKVICKRYGKGKVHAVNDGTYPIVVTFTHGVETYTISGRLYEDGPKILKLAKKVKHKKKKQVIKGYVITTVGEVRVIDRMILFADKGKAKSECPEDGKVRKAELTFK